MGVIKHGLCEGQMNHSALVLFIFLAAVYGLSTAIAVLKIGQHIFGLGHCPNKECSHKGHPKELRRFLGRIPVLGDLFYCPPCLAFWIGSMLSLFVLSPSSLVVPVRGFSAALDGLMACGVVWLLHVSAEKLAHGLDL